MKIEAAATKIQAAFRGHQVRKGTTMKQGDVNGSEAGQQQNSAETEREPTKAELEAEFDPNDEELSISQHYYEPTYWAVADLEAPG
ncbi:predicted protein [Culex quinquefasciatus]|uniref:Predicted protein n=1 Tax=Culex quinquefasciatus TaxID=7176 RepID=B0WD76_CULQU|nr:predicted protein [Culex quinquefasciatus]|eukprot:XP_001846660.1 predicted protein [Culex quinquefasciatus]